MAAEPANGHAKSVSKIRAIGRAPLFASVIDSFEIPDAGPLNDQLREEISAWHAQSPRKRQDGLPGWTSDASFFDREEPGFRALQAHITQALTQVARQYWPVYDPNTHATTKSGWVNVNGKGAFNAPHDHALYDLSGSYYVATPQSGDSSAGAIEFISPMAGYNPYRPFSRLLAHKRVTVQPRAGQLMIYPSYLSHWVYPNPSDEERIVVSFNMAVVEERLE